ncbi:uncharacterized protein [Typha latifolia]|uniref:uncharacterized protein isoform X1 n=1 Tax=Typha latifolia TaxID=4733 RepID=UPI003C2E1DAE
MGGDSASDLRLSPAKRPKTLASSPSSTAKGKEKIVEWTPPAAATGHIDFGLDIDKSCGICLSGVGSGRLVRGEIDSCDHFFCFVCIMEWAKVESRCPFCKRRFRTIRRPPAIGIFPSERVVEVPVRDQVHHPLGNESTQNFDPYANTNCSVCHVSKDEELLLLCDLCDSAAHTYCVGLGVTVPFGDWYCLDCAACRYEHSNNQNDEDTCNQDPNKSTSTFRVSEAPAAGSTSIQVSEVPVSIFDIVAEETTLSSSQRFSATQILERQRPAEISTSRGKESRSFSPAYRRTQGARTLRNLCNLCDRVQVLRENWTAIRAGTLGFSSSLSDSASLASERERNDSTGRTTSHAKRELDPSLLVNSEQILSSSASRKISNSGGSQDVNKAWKMMETAKSTEKTHRGPAHNVAVQTGGEENEKFSLKVVHHGEPQYGTKQKMDGQVAKKVPHLVRRQKNNHVAIRIEKASVKQEKLSKQDSICLGMSMPDPQQVETLQSTLYNNQEEPRNHISMPPSVSSASTSSFREPTEFSSRVSEPYIMKENKDTIIEENSTTLSRMANNNAMGRVEPSDKVKVDLLGKDQRVSNFTDADERSVKTNAAKEGAKSEVQSLVKLNLKLLNRDRKLGADRFKEVARIATHTVLAACGLEHSRSIVRPFSNSICKHSEEIKMLSRSNLMASSCRKCFYSFIQEVVNSVMSEKHSHRASSD